MLFDPYVVVESYFQSHPKLAEKYKFNGLWKKDDFQEDSIIVIFQEKINMNWGRLAQQAID